jgi:hypothetical protein
LICVPLQAEEAVKSAGFARAAIFRPGLLDRGDKARLWEKVIGLSEEGVPEEGRLLVCLGLCEK